MNYDRVILELLNRVATLEEKVDALEKGKVRSEVNPSDNLNEAYVKKNLSQEIREYIIALKTKAKEAGKTELILNCNDLQKVFKISNRTVSVCSAMYKVMEKGDVVLSAPPSGYSTTVTVKYFL